jgi:hypothetical protein
MASNSEIAGAGRSTLPGYDRSHVSAASVGARSPRHTIGTAPLVVEAVQALGTEAAIRDVLAG